MNLSGFTALLLETLSCSWGYLKFIASAVVLLLAIHVFLKPHREVFRKILHIAAFSSCVAFVLCTDDWRAASLSSALFAAVVYPILSLAERWQGYGHFFNQRRRGEVKRSLLLLFFSFAAINALCWGALRQPWIGVAAVLMWGPGDGAAALVGMAFGRHKVRLPLADPKKSWEGTLSMALVSFVIGCICLTASGVFPAAKAFAVSAVTAAAAAYTELITRNGNDTVTVPAVNTLLLSALYLML